MPTYEYRCTSCKHTFERVQRMTDKPVSRCPKCGKGVEKVFHAVPILFNGPGFHVNDYAPDKTGGNGSKPPKPGSTADSKTETVKPSSKPDPSE
jgi:putative FmdB family regulatory protein